MKEKLKDLLTKITQGDWVICYDGQIDGNGGKNAVCNMPFSSFKEYNDDDEAKSNSKLISLAPQLAKRVIELEELLSEAMKKEEEIFEANKREADWFNNNTPYVGQTVEYKSYPPLPKWVDKAKQLLNQ